MLIRNAFLILFSLVFSGPAFSHGDGEERVSLEAETQGDLTAGPIKYDFELFDSTAKKVLTNNDLTETHTKILHLIAYDSSLNEFNHVHPEFDGKLWKSELNLPRNGTYFIWAQGQLLDGTEFSTFSKSKITNGLPETAPVPLGDHRKNSDRSTVIEIANTKIRAGKTAMVNFTVTRNDGQQPVLTPYLGAFAHLIAASPDGDELIHVHPMSGGAPNTGMIHAVFPTEGDYRIWVQLIDRGDLKTIPVSVTVLK